MAEILPVKPYRQSPGQCGAACLKMVLSYYGIEKPEKAIVKLTKGSTAKGTSARQLVVAARKLGLRGSVKDDSSLREIAAFLKAGIPVIVDWFSADDGHYSVVVGLDRKHIYLQDPEIGHLRTMSRETFLRVWFDFPGRFMKERSDLILRGMIVIRK
jgi:ABC-type bacteriocin/lantibiotic exporter with double-glycine peptidase domain